MILISIMVLVVKTVGNGDHDSGLVVAVVMIW